MPIEGAQVELIQRARHAFPRIATRGGQEGIECLPFGPGGGEHPAGRPFPMNARDEKGGVISVDLSESSLMVRLARIVALFQEAILCLLDPGVDIAAWHKETSQSLADLGAAEISADGLLDPRVLDL